jgi:tRNA-2-methylthio-N6-dimethylallyladenosine synthase
MRRNSSREVSLALIDPVRKVIPKATISTDMISGFCEETEEEHKDTISLMKRVEYDHAYMFAYSMREKTHAHRNYSDKVPEPVKNRRLREVIDTFHELKREKVKKQIGIEKLVLVEGSSKRSDADLSGRSDENERVLFPRPEGSETVQAGDYVVVKVTSGNTMTLKGEYVKQSSIKEFFD